MGNEEQDIGAAFGSMLTGESITRLMKEDGPIVTAVQLSSSGDAKEITLDMTPNKNELVKVLGGKISFYGQYEDLEVVVVALAEFPVLQPVNDFKLPPPLHSHDIKGDVILLKVNEDSVPENFTVTEWLEFLKQDFTALKAEWDERDQAAEEEAAAYEGACY